MRKLEEKKAELDRVLTELESERASHRQTKRLLRENSEHKQIERAIEENEERYRSLFTQSRDGITLLSLDHVIMEANQHLADMLGYEIDDLIGVCVYDFFLPEEMSQAFKRAEKVSRGQVLPITERGIKRKDGSIFIGEANLSLVKGSDGQPLYLLGIIRDITERKQLEETLKEREAQLRQIGDNLPDSMVYRLVHTPDGRRSVSYISEGVERLYGISVEEAMKDINILYGMMLPEDLEAVILAEKRSLETLDRFDWEGRFRLRSGEIRWSRYHSKPSLLADGTRIWDGVALDITQQKKIEKARDQHLKELTTLHQIANELTNITDLPSNLDHVTKIIESHFDARFVIIAITHEDELIKPITQTEQNQKLPSVLPLSEAPRVQEVIDQGKTFIISDLQSSIHSPEIRAWAEDLNLYCALLTPLAMRGAVFGFVLICLDQKNRIFSADEIALAETISGDIASAIDNARLFSLVQNKAVADERIRIARDLHDSVTQTMYSVSIVAEALPRLLDRDREEAKRRAIHLRQMTLGALAEMRNLLFEFHPKALKDTGLNILVQQLSDVLTGRTRIPVDLFIEGDMQIPEDVKITFYRVTQEAFNNIAKHADATQVFVVLKSKLNTCRLSINDNGIGFDLDAINSEKLGLKIMHERVEEIGGNLIVKSAPDHGTQISLFWSGLPTEKS
jgi:PAS domain S-box-containing protein